jgi:hypothetical protein
MMRRASYIGNLAADQERNHRNYGCSGDDSTNPDIFGQYQRRSAAKDVDNLLDCNKKRSECKNE